jgi:hypothetical protein
MLRFEVLPRFTGTSVCSNFANPFADSIVTVYIPGSIFAIRKRPSSLLVELVERPPCRVAVTVTPGTAAPVESVTTPSIEPVVVVWAKALPANSAKQTRSVDKLKNLRTFFIFSFPFLNYTAVLPLLC